MLKSNQTRDLTDPINTLSRADACEYLKLQESFIHAQNSRIRDRRGNSFKVEIDSIIRFVDSRPEDRELRALATGLIRTGSYLCVNSQRLKTFVKRCKSSINNGFQQLGFDSVKSRGRSNSCLAAALPSIANSSSLGRQWTVRCIEKYSPLSTGSLLSSSSPTDGSYLATIGQNTNTNILSNINNNNNALTLLSSSPIHSSSSSSPSSVMQATIGNGCSSPTNVNNNIINFNSNNNSSSATLMATTATGGSNFFGFLERSKSAAPFIRTPLPIPILTSKSPLPIPKINTNSASSASSSTSLTFNNNNNNNGNNNSNSNSNSSNNNNNNSNNGNQMSNSNLRSALSSALLTTPFLLDVPPPMPEESLVNFQAPEFFPSWDLQNDLMPLGQPSMEMRPFDDSFINSFQETNCSNEMFSDEGLALQI